MGMITLPDGRLLFPHIGNPPIPPVGYDTDPADPYILIPDYDACSQRMSVAFTKPCGKLSHRCWCKLHDCEATPGTCAECPDIDLVSIDSSFREAINSIVETVILTPVIEPVPVTEIVSVPPPVTGPDTAIPPTGTPQTHEVEVQQSLPIGQTI